MIATTVMRMSATIRLPYGSVRSTWRDRLGFLAELELADDLVEQPGVERDPDLRHRRAGEREDEDDRVRPRSRVTAGPRSRRRSPRSTPNTSSAAMTTRPNRWRYDWPTSWRIRRIEIGGVGCAPSAAVSSSATPARSSRRAAARACSGSPRRRASSRARPRGTRRSCGLGIRAAQPQPDRADGVEDAARRAAARARSASSACSTAGSASTSSQPKPM